MEKQFIAQLKDNDPVDSLFLVKEKNMLVGKNGRAYLSLTLGDRSGSLDAKVWDRVEEQSALFAIGDVIQVKGQMQLFQSKRQLVIHKITTSEEEHLMDDFITKSELDPAALYAELMVIARSVEGDQIRQLILDTLEDPEIKPLLLRAPAAKSIHHAWEGGLMEHIVSICKIMDFMGDHYPFLRKDLLIFGAIFHDIGKIWELTLENGIQYSDRGRLIGHMALACELVDKKTSKIFGFSEELKDICKHIILSHHGRLEYGSPKRPKFLEAMVVAMVDDLDSKITSLNSFLKEERAAGGKWSRYSPLFDRYFLLKDFNEDEG